MTKLFKKELNINGILFNIYSNYTFEIEEYFKEFIVPSTDEIIGEYNIYFEKDKSIFEKVYKSFDKSKSIIIDTFKNQKHYQQENMFLIDNEDYICIKDSNFDYKLFTSGKENSLKYLIRIIREILIRALESNGYFYMHGTGIEIYDKGILILGGSGSGKTTFATRLNEISTPQKYLSNDRVFLKQDGLRYFPLPIIYAMGTVKSNRELDNYFKSTHALEKRRGGNYILARSNVKCDIPLTDISRIFVHIQNVSSMNVDLIVFPNMSGSEVRVKELDEKDIIRRLNESNFTPEDKESLRREWLLKRSVTKEEIEENKRKLNQYLIRTKKIFEVEYTRESTKEEIIKELVKRL